MNPIEKILRIAIVVIFVLTFILSLASCGNQYSPLDNYVNTLNQKYADSVRHDKEVRVFLDSLNSK